MAWAIWGRSRVENEDDVIHHGETEAQVEFIFSFMRTFTASFGRDVGDKELRWSFRLRRSLMRKLADRPSPYQKPLDP